MAQLAATTLALPDRYAAMLHELLAAHLRDVEVWAYGSRVTGGSHPASDLDLVARSIPNPNTPAAGLIPLRTALMESNLPIRVQIVDWARLPAPMREEIGQAYVPIWPI